MKLNQVVTISSGYPFRGSITESTDPDAIVIQMKDVSSENEVNWVGCVTTKLAGKRAPQILKPGDVLFAARGNHNYAIHIDDEIHDQLFPVVAAPHFFVISDQDKTILPAYLAWFLNQAPSQRYFEQNAEGSFAKSIRRSVLEETPIVVPNLKKQQTIVELSKTLKKQKQLFEKTVENNLNLLNSIASKLLLNA